MPPFDVWQRGDHIEHFALKAVHIVFLGCVEGMGDGTNGLQRSYHLKKSISFFAEQLSTVNPFGELCFLIFCLQRFNLVLNPCCIGELCDFDSRQFVFGHVANDAPDICLYFLDRIPVILAKNPADIDNAGF